MPESKFKIFDTNKNNTFNDGESFTSFDNGFEPGDVVESKPVNTGLYQSTLITKAFIDALGDSSNIGYSTSYTDLVQYIKTKFTDLGGVIQAKNLTITTNAETLEWNKFFYKINKTVATESTITLGSINDNIKNEVTVMLTTNVVNTKIRFAGVETVYLINHGTTNVTDAGLVFTFQDKGTYIIKLLAKNPSVVYAEVSKGEYSATTYLNNPEVTVNDMSSPQGAYPRLSFAVKNTNAVEVKPTFSGDASGISIVNIPANGTKTYTKTMNKYEGSFAVSISDPNSQVLGNPNVTKSWSVTPTFAQPSISFSGTGTSRTLTITRAQGQGGSTTTTDYKVWKSNESEPSSYTNTSNTPYTQALTNNTYESITYKVKARTKAVYGGKTSYTEDVTNQVNIEGQVKPTLKVPTISLVNQTTSQITFKVTNNNNVACNIYWKVTGGSFQAYDSKVNPSSSLDCTITTSVRPTTIYVYLVATNYTNSGQISLEVSKPKLIAPSIQKNITYLNPENLTTLDNSNWLENAALYFDASINNPNNTSVTLYYRFTGGASHDTWHSKSMSANQTLNFSDSITSQDIIFSSKLECYFTANGYTQSDTSSRSSSVKKITLDEICGPSKQLRVSVSSGYSSNFDEDVFYVHFENKFPFIIYIDVNDLTYKGSSDGRTHESNNVRGRYTVESKSYANSTEERNEYSINTSSGWYLPINDISIEQSLDVETIYFDLNTNRWQFTPDGVRVQ